MRKETAIPVGPGRGSAAGSLIAYVMRITDLDPIEHGLIFERFLNLERISMPDIDVDFCVNGRDRVLEYVANKYGKDRVAQIATFGTMQARAVIRDVGRALAMPYNDVDRIAKLIPPTLGIDLNKALQIEPRLSRDAGGKPAGKGTVRNRPCPRGAHPPRLHSRRRSGHVRQAHRRIHAALRRPGR